MEYKPENGNILLFQPDFDLDQTLDCGQAFRWKKAEDSCFQCSYEGFFLDKYLKISHKGENMFILHNTSEEEFLSIWKDYFDLDRDYGKIKARLSTDPTLKKACEFAWGIRLLKQDSWECICSFIISQNNNIPRIKGIISRLYEHYSHFPTADELAQETPESLSYLRSGFRAKYLIDAALKVSSNEVNLKLTQDMELDNARQALMTIKGIGPKVADCVLLFGMHRAEAFPVDVWIKRVMEQYYPSGLPKETAGIEGIAQQYLFHYIRKCNPQ